MPYTAFSAMELGVFIFFFMFAISNTGAVNNSTLADGKLKTSLEYENLQCS